MYRLEWLLEEIPALKKLQLNNESLWHLFKADI